MVTLNIKGFSYGKASTINLQLCYYIYNNAFTNSSISSAGGDVPEVWLTNEGGKVVVFINDRVYYQRFTVDAFAMGMNEPMNWYQGWSIIDEEMTGTNSLKLKYLNRFAGNVFGENLLMSGKIGIGTNSPQEALSVNGNIRAKEIKVEASPWPDYVFEDSYELIDLKQLEEFIKLNKHLPEIPKASQVENEGAELGKMNGLLLKKIEELTIYLIQKDKQIDALNEKVQELDSKLNNIGTND